jgi:hypothetical protein
MSELARIPDTAALAWTPHDPLYVFFNPQWIGLNAAGRNLGNEALIFHEALHGFTGLTDDQLLTALRWPWLDSSCKVNISIQRDVLERSPGLNSFVRMICARPPYPAQPPNP